MFCSVKKSNSCFAGWIGDCDEQPLCYKYWKNFVELDRIKHLLQSTCDVDNDEYWTEKTTAYNGKKRAYFILPKLTEQLIDLIYNYFENFNTDCQFSLQCKFFPKLSFNFFYPLTINNTIYNTVTSELQLSNNLMKSINIFQDLYNCDYNCNNSYSYDRVNKFESICNLSILLTINSPYNERQSNDNVQIVYVGSSEERHSFEFEMKVDITVMSVDISLIYNKYGKNGIIGCNQWNQMAPKLFGILGIKSNNQHDFNLWQRKRRFSKFVHADFQTDDGFVLTKEIFLSFLQMIDDFKDTIDVDVQTVITPQFQLFF